jgi:tetratricopeptide (TPR) repeat protein
MLMHTLAGAYEQRGDLIKDADDLRRSVELFKQVLEVHTREKTPAQWIKTSNNLAVSLKELSDTTTDPAQLKEAIAVYRDVLTATSRENLPLDWADYNQNLGNSLGVLAEYEDPIVNLEAALDAYRLAGEVTTLDRGPAKWEELQNAISLTLLMHSLKSFDASKAKEAHDLAVATRDKLRELGAPDEPYFEMFIPMTEQVIGMLPQ